MPQPRRKDKGDPAPPEIERPRLLLALAARAQLPVRVLCAPAGAGKTTLLRQYVAATRGARYLAARPGLSAASLHEALAEPGEGVVVLDDFDLVEPLVATALIRAVMSGRLAPRRLIIAGRARRLLHVRRLIARGLAALLDARDLAFDPEEARRLASKLGLSFEDEELARLLDLTDGWTLALSWILRTAASDITSLHCAVERWSSWQGGALLEYVEENAFDDVDVRRVFITALSEASHGGKTAWESVEAAGGPVIWAEGELRPYRIIATLAGR
jgi:ATP/maltotriose-dependent transcriptional regulator MalT